MPKQNITLKPQVLGVEERGGSTDKYPEVRRQVRKRLVEIDNEIAMLQAKKKKLLEA